MIREYSAGIIVFLEHRESTRTYLILHYLSGHWDFSKGHIEPGETEIDAAKRELLEETGLTATVVEGFEGSLTYFHHLPDTKELAFKQVTFFAGKASSDQITLSPEHIDYKWLTYHDALEQLTYDNAKEVLKNLETFLQHQE